MDAVEYLKESYRMCRAIGKCASCPFGEYGVAVIPCKINDECLELTDPEKAVQIVEQWAEKHPAKTRQSEFLKIFPEATLKDGKFIDICPRSVNRKIKSDNECTNLYCVECMKDFWLEEVE